MKIKESEKRDKYLDLARKKKKQNKKKTTMAHEDDGNTNCNWCTWNNYKGLIKGQEN